LLVRPLELIHDAAVLHIAGVLEYHSPGMAPLKQELYQLAASKRDYAGQPAVKGFFQNSQ
jgi:hypothetical protein